MNASRDLTAQVRVTGTPPSPRGGHTAVVYGERLYAFGGKSGRSPFNDLCAFDFERAVWTPLEAHEAGRVDPAPRCAHVCVVHGTPLPASLPASPSGGSIAHETHMPQARANTSERARR